MGAVDEIQRTRTKQSQISLVNDGLQRKKSIADFCLLVAAASLFTWSMLASISATAGDNDHLIITVKEQTFKSVIQDVLRTSRFADPIASYNGVDSIAAMLPLGTTVRIPKPYIEVLNFGQIAFVKGDVTLAKADSVVNPPGKGALVHNGDIIRTGDSGFVSVSFHSGAQFNLQPGSIVQVNNVRCLAPNEKCLIELEATKGSVTSEVQPRPDDKPPVEFSVTTPFLSAAVRGTVFYVDVDEKVNRVGVTRGLVAADSSGTQLDLPSGKGMSATESSAPVAVDLLPEPVFSGNNQQVVFSAEDSFEWLAIDGANTYQVKVASDFGISQLASMDLVELPGFSATLAAGDYFLSVAAVDDSDFVGIPLIKPIRLADITDEIKPELKIERRADQVTLQLTGVSADHDGPVELLIGNSIDHKPESIETIEDLSEPLTLTLAEDQTWVFRVRKVMGPYAVSAYSNHYQLSAK